jgi:serine/threonine protein kinase
MISRFDTKLKILNACKIKGFNQSNKENSTSTKIKLKNLRVFGALGSGTFGNVFKVYDPDRKEFYALKCIERSKV